MNSKAQLFVKNLSYTLAANITSMLISTLVVLIMPKIIGVQDYGYFQLYIFYSLYMNIFQFGWNDGIYLRYGGHEYNSLDKRLFFSQFWMLTISQFIIAGIIIVTSLNITNEKGKVFILIMVALHLIISGVRDMLLFILQATNKIKAYAQITMMDKILYCSLIVIFLAVGVRKYKFMIVADLAGGLISLLYAMYCCRDMVFCRISQFYFSFRETLKNINVGIKLMLANIASMLIIGIVRFGIEHSWDVKTFGRVSLTLSVSNIMTLFINAVGIIMFPILRRTNEKKLPSIYITMRDFLVVILLGALIICYPLKFVLSVWLPKYADSLKYMALVFPMCVFEGKMALLNNTYLKTLRKEKLMLKINLTTLTLSIILTFITTILLKNLNLAVVSIIVLLTFRCVLAEMFISKILKISLYKDIIMELTMTLIFILTGWFINSCLVVLFYGAAYIIYLFIKRKDITKTIKNVKLLMKA